MFSQAQKKLLFLSALGGVLEFYDFVIYAFLTPYLSKEFFPTQDHTLSLIMTFATFSIGYLVRPLGGIIFGHFGDKLGRKKTFTFSILIMALSTLSIAFIPSYAVIGIAAPFILITGRILQGLSLSGEIPGALTYVSESMPEKKGFACGIIFFSLILGIGFGSLILAMLQACFTEQVLLIWGWRIPFVIGGIFGLLSYFLRRQLKESQLFLKIKNETARFPIMDVLLKAPRNCLLACFLTGSSAAAPTLLLLFTPTYITSVLNISSNSYVWWNTVAVFLAAFFSFVLGLLADKTNLKALCFIVLVSTIILAYPIFIIFSNYFDFYFIALFMCAFLAGAYGGSIPGFLPELFATSYRYSGIALSYNVGFAIFGGLAPLVAMILINKTNSVTSPALYLVCISALAGIALYFLKATKLEKCEQSNDDPYLE